MPGVEGARGRVAILLSTYDGARFLPEQLASFSAQQGADWTLHWRDDGSRDDTRAVLRAFAAASGRCVEHGDDDGNIGVLASYMRLLRAVAPSLGAADSVAFADQDDVWLPEKLARGVAALAGAASPALYCARYVLVDARLRRLGVSDTLRRPPGMPQALVQNIATGCTILLDAAAARLVAGSDPPPGSVHDWWSYLVVAASGGRVIRDETPVLLYRQHAGNAIGAAEGWLCRAQAAMRRGPAAFTGLLRAHVAALLAETQPVSDESRHLLHALQAALAAPPPRPGLLLRWPGLLRQGFWETQLLRLWLLLG